MKRNLCVNKCKAEVWHENLSDVHLSGACLLVNTQSHTHIQVTTLTAEQMLLNYRG